MDWIRYSPKLWYITVRGTKYSLSLTKFTTKNGINTYYLILIIYQHFTLKLSFTKWSPFTILDCYLTLAIRVLANRWRKTTAYENTTIATVSDVMKIGKVNTIRLSRYRKCPFKLKLCIKDFWVENFLCVNFY